MHNWYYFTKGFSKKELQKIEKGVKDLKFQAALTGEPDQRNSLRSSKIKWIGQNEEWRWLYEKLELMIKEANDCLWNFNLYSMPDNIQYTEYRATENGKYDWHMDCADGETSLRKVSVTVQLSHPDEYEGGDLELFRGGLLEDPREKAGREEGLVFIFPSYMMHRVTPVTKGVRKSFVLWVGGEHYK